MKTTTSVICPRNAHGPRNGWSARIASAAILLGGLSGVASAQSPPVNPTFGGQSLNTVQPKTQDGFPGQTKGVPGQTETRGGYPGSGGPAGSYSAGGSGYGELQGRHSERGGDSRVRIYTLRHVAAAEVSELLKELFGLRPQVVSDKVVLAATEKEHAEIETMLAQLDVAETSAANSKGTNPLRIEDPLGNGASLKIDFVYRDESIETLRRAYEASEQTVRNLKSQFKASAAAPTADDPLRVQLRAAVAEAFKARQALLRAELVEFRQRMDRLGQSIERRNRLADQIIDRRVDDLLNPSLNWSESTSTPREVIGRIAITSTTAPPFTQKLSLLATSKGKPIEDATIDIFRQEFEPGAVQPRVDRLEMTKTDSAGRCEITLKGATEIWKVEPRSGYLIYVSGPNHNVKCLVINGDSYLAGSSPIPLTVEFDVDKEPAPYVPPRHLAIGSRLGVTITPSRDNVEGFALKEEGASAYSTPAKTVIEKEVRF